MAIKAVLFDLDGTLVDSTYQHVSAWMEALHDERCIVPAVEIHRRIGMNARLILEALNRSLELGLDVQRRKRIEAAHAAASNVCLSTPRTMTTVSSCFP